MVRSYWIGPVLLVLAVTGLAWSQVLSPGSTPASPKEHTLTLQETDRPPLKCKILKMWHEPDGGRAFQVQALSTGEMVTLVQKGASAGEPAKTATSKIYHWGDENKPPAGAPIAPANATVLAMPGAAGTFPNEHFPPRTVAESPKPSNPGQPWPAAYSANGPDAKPFDAKPYNDLSASTVVVKSPPTEAKPAIPDKLLPGALVPEDKESKPIAKPVEMSGAATKKTEAAISTTTPVAPIQASTNDSKKMVALSDLATKKADPGPGLMNLGVPDKGTGNDTSKPVPAPVQTVPMPTMPVPGTPIPVAPVQAAPIPAAPVPAAPVPGTPLITAAPVVVPHVPDPAPKQLMPEITHAEETKQPLIVTHDPPVNGASPSVGTAEKVITQAPPKSIPPVVEPTVPVTVKAPPAQGPEIKPSPKPPAPQGVAKVEPTKPSDWRQSWGRVEPLPPGDDRPVVKTTVPKKADVPVKVDLPHADTTKVDPLQHPDRYAKLPIPANNSSKPIQQVKNAVDGDSNAVKPPVVPVDLSKSDNNPGVATIPVTAPPEAPKPNKPPTAVVPPFMPGPPPAQSDKNAVPAKPAEVAKPYVPPGMGSVVAAKMVETPVIVPDEKAAPTAKAPANIYDGGNAFTPAQPLQTNPNRGNPMMPPPNYPQGNPTMPPNYVQGNPTMMRPLPPPPPPGVVQIPMDRGVPSGMANAFTNGASSRPMPPDAGQPTQDGNAFSPPSPSMGAPQMANGSGNPNLVAMVDPRSLPAQLPPVEQARANNTNQLLAVLRDSLYPSQREWSADGLGAQQSSASNPQVVQSLLMAAKEDPAPTVRAACIRALVQLQINTVPAVALVQALKSDADPRVRREAEQALPVLTGGQPLPLDPSVRPVSSH